MAHATIVGNMVDFDEPDLTLGSVMRVGIEREPEFTDYSDLLTDKEFLVFLEAATKGAGTCVRDVQDTIALLQDPLFIGVLR